MSFTRYGVTRRDRTVNHHRRRQWHWRVLCPRLCRETVPKVAFLDQQRETGAALADSHGEGVGASTLPALRSRRHIDGSCAPRSARFAPAIGPAAGAGQQPLPTTSATSSTRSHTGAIRPHDCGQFPPCVFRGTSNRAADARAGLRLDRQYVLGVVECAASRCSKPMPRPRQRSSAFTNTLARALGPHRIRSTRSRRAPWLTERPAPAVVSEPKRRSEAATRRRNA